MYRFIYNKIIIYMKVFLVVICNVASVASHVNDASGQVNKVTSFPPNQGP